MFTLSLIAMPAFVKTEESVAKQKLDALTSLRKYNCGISAADLIGFAPYAFGKFVNLPKHEVLLAGYLKAYNDCLNGIGLHFDGAAQSQEDCKSLILGMHQYSVLNLEREHNQARYKENSMLEQQQLNEHLQVRKDVCTQFEQEVK